MRLKEVPQKHLTPAGPGYSGKLVIQLLNMFRKTLMIVNLMVQTPEVTVRALLLLLLLSLQ
jgi:hypothetical protein